MAFPKNFWRFVIGSDRSRWCCVEDGLWLCADVDWRSFLTHWGEFFRKEVQRKGLLREGSNTDDFYCTKRNDKPWAIWYIMIMILLYLQVQMKMESLHSAQHIRFQMHSVRPIYCSTLFTKYHINKLRCYKKIYYGWPTNDHTKKGYEVFFNIIINISKYNFQSALGGVIGGTHSVFSDKSHSYRKLDLKTLEWVMRSSTGPALKD